MPFHGQIVSHDPQMQVGFIMVHGTGQGVAFLQGDIRAKEEDLQTLIGKTVIFDVVHTARGPMAVNISFLSKRIVKSGDWLLASVSPILVIITTIFFYEYLFWPLIPAYLVAINLVTFLLFIFIGLSSRSFYTSPAEISLAVHVIVGGSLAAVFALFFIPGKWQRDAMRFGIFFLLFAHGFILHFMVPDLFSRAAIKEMFKAEQLHRER